MTRQHLFAGFFFAVFLFLLYQLYRMFQGFLVPMGWAALLAVVFYPVYVRLTQWLGGRDGLAAFILTTTVIAVVMVPTIALTILVANESVALYQRSNEFVTSGGPERLLEYLKASSARRLWDVVGTRLDSWNIDISGVALKSANAVSAFLVSQAADMAKNVAGFVGDFFLCTIALFFFFRDGNRMVTAVRDLLPMEAAHKDLVLTRFYEALSAVVQGTLVTAALQGLLAGLGFWALGVPFAIFLGCASALLSLIPFASPVVWGLVAIYLGVTGAIARAVGLILWGILVIGTVDNFIRPLIIGGRTAIPTILLFFGILGGLQAYGLVGLFLAPALIAILVAFVRIYWTQYGIVLEPVATNQSETLSAQIGKKKD